MPGSATFSVKGQRENMLDFVGHWFQLLKFATEAWK